MAVSNVNRAAMARRGEPAITPEQVTASMRQNVIGNMATAAMPARGFDPSQDQKANQAGYPAIDPNSIRSATAPQSGLLNDQLANRSSASLADYVRTGQNGTLTNATQAQAAAELDRRAQAIRADAVSKGIVPNGAPYEITPDGKFVDFPGSGFYAGLDKAQQAVASAPQGIPDRIMATQPSYRGGIAPIAAPTATITRAPPTTPLTGPQRQQAAAARFSNPYADLSSNVAGVGTAIENTDWLRNISQTGVGNSVTGAVPSVGVGASTQPATSAKMASLAKQVAAGKYAMPSYGPDDMGTGMAPSSASPPAQSVPTPTRTTPRPASPAEVAGAINIDTPLSSLPSTNIRNVGRPYGVAPREPLTSGLPSRDIPQRPAGFSAGSTAVPTTDIPGSVRQDNMGVSVTPNGGRITNGQTSFPTSTTGRGATTVAPYSPPARSQPATTAKDVSRSVSDSDWGIGPSNSSNSPTGAWDAPKMSRAVGGGINVAATRSPTVRGVAAAQAQARDFANTFDPLDPSSWNAVSAMAGTPQVAPALPPPPANPRATLQQPMQLLQPQYRTASAPAGTSYNMANGVAGLAGTGGRLSSRNASYTNNQNAPSGRTSNSQTARDSKGNVTGRSYTDSKQRTHSTTVIGGREYTNARGSSGAGSGGGSTILCTYFMRKGWLPVEIWRADMTHAKTVNPIMREGYYAWAEPCIERMKVQDGFAKVLERILWPVVKGWSHEAAYLSGYLPHGTIRGKIVRVIFEPASYLIGLAKKRAASKLIRGH